MTPLTALVLASLFTTAGLPPGVFNVLQGDGSVGAALSSDPRIAKISFTGQTSTGTSVYTSAAKTLKHVTLELGGKSPLIVFPDANLSAAVDACLTANFFSSGQVCTAGSRVFVHRDIRAAFQELLVARVLDCVRPGNPMALETNFGPLVSETQRRRVETYIRHGSETDHATLLLGGLGSPPELPPGGYYVRPTVFTDCTDDMRIVREEIFGPVACLLEFTSEEEVVRRANGLEYGLAAGVFTRDLDTAHRVVAGVRAGIFWVNTWGESPAQMPVGGWGCSGLGVENGEEALGLFARNKSVLVESGDAPVAFAKL